MLTVYLPGAWICYPVSVHLWTTPEWTFFYILLFLLFNLILSKVSVQRACYFWRNISGRSIGRAQRQTPTPHPPKVIDYVFFYPVLSSSKWSLLWHERESKSLELPGPLSGLRTMDPGCRGLCAWRARDVRMRPGAHNLLCPLPPFENPGSPLNMIAVEMSYEVLRKWQSPLVHL